MKRLRSGGLFSGYLLHCLHSGHVSRGHRPSLTKKWALFFVLGGVTKNWAGVQYQEVRAGQGESRRG